MSKLIKLFLSGFFLVSLFGLVSFLEVRAASTASVTATVTVQNISITVADGTVAYGTLVVNTSAGTNAADTQTATNNGNVAEAFNIRGQASAGWTLGATAGSDIYVHKFCPVTCTTPPTGYTALTTSNQTLAASVAASGTQTFDLYITTPTVSTVFTSQSVDVTITAIAV